jgi:Fe-S oxidoreductase
LEERSIRATRALASLLKQAGIDFAILGAEESCCGEPARRLGNEYLFQMQAQENISKLKSYGVKKIVSGCPHCYNTIKNEYPIFGGKIEITHHSQLIAELIEAGKLVLKNRKNSAITYHDPCYLGRYNGVFKPPRNILKKLPGTKLVEMKKKGKNSFCCGGGGGRIWQEENTVRRISEMRIEQALETKAETMATTCPLCLQMFEDAIKVRDYQSSIRVKDIGELVAEAAGLPKD